MKNLKKTILASTAALGAISSIPVSASAQNYYPIEGNWACQGSLVLNMNNAPTKLAARVTYDSSGQFSRATELFLETYGTATLLEQGTYQYTNGVLVEDIKSLIPHPTDHQGKPIPIPAPQGVTVNFASPFQMVSNSPQGQNICNRV